PLLLDRHQVGVLRVAPNVCPDERAERDDALAAGTDVLERAADEHSAEPSPLERRLDVGVHEHDRSRLPPVADLTGEFPIDTKLVAELLRVVLDADVGRLPITVRNARPPRAIWPRPRRCRARTHATLAAGGAGPSTGRARP